VPLAGRDRSLLQESAREALAGGPAVWRYPRGSRRRAPCRGPRGGRISLSARQSCREKARRGRRAVALAGVRPDPTRSKDPDTSLWRTYQACLFGEWEPFSGTFPPSGMMRSGRCFRRAPWVRHIHGKECSLWRTPLARDWKGYTKRAGESLCNQLRRLYGGSGKPNPRWIEWLQGFPAGWLPLKDSETLASPRSPSGSGASSSPTSIPASPPHPKSDRDLPRVKAAKKDGQAMKVPILEADAPVRGLPSLPGGEGGTETGAAPVDPDPLPVSGEPSGSRDRRDQDEPRSEGPAGGFQFHGRGEPVGPGGTLPPPAVLPASHGLIRRRAGEEDDEPHGQG
jgi:hypothetical protein